MEVTLLFMKMEDKYWGLFLAALFFLFVLCLMYKDKDEKKARNYLFLSLYGVIAYLLFLCPPVYAAVTKLCPQLSGYYELSHVQMMVPVMVIAAVMALEAARKEGKGRMAGLLAGFFVLLAATGDFAYVPAEDAKWQAECSLEEKEAFDLILRHAKDRDDDGRIRIWGMEELMAKSRLYDSDFQPLYGKDIGVSPEKYSALQQAMYQCYSAYDVVDGTAINIKDRLDALSGPPHQYAELDCEYVILHDPKKQFDDYEEFFKDDEFDAVSYFSALGYEAVGRTEHMLLFYRQEG